MQIHIKRLDENFLMEAKNEHQHTIIIDSSTDETPKGMSPMQLLLAGIGACSTIDIIDILKKQRQNLNNIEIFVNGDRVETIPNEKKRKPHQVFV
ncbi:MAG: OsmC family protein [Raineya sp.]